MSNFEVLYGDALEILRGMPDCSVDAVVTDPPYGLSQHKPAVIADTLARWVSGDTEYTPPAKGGFMGKTWDSFVPPPAVWAECLRVLKPGGHLLVFAGSRTQDLMGMSVRLAGFEIRDGIGWIYGSGFPKSMDVSKAIDKAAGAEREVTGQARGHVPTDGGNFDDDAYEWKPVYDRRDIPATPAAEQWAGWGTALKPAIEPVIVARKPFAGTVAANVLEWGTGALNIDASRVGTEVRVNRGMSSLGVMHDDLWEPSTTVASEVSGRFPPNVLLDPEAAAAMDEQSGITRSNVRTPTGKDTRGIPNTESQIVVRMRDTQERGHNDSGGASRFFPVFKYQAKAPTKERPQYTAEDGRVVKHPTVKPLELMRWLVRLVTPPGGVVLDPFAGSGTTGEAAHLEGFDSILIEGATEHLPLIHERYRRSSAPDTEAA